jgi:hypothetical protein
VTITAKKTVRSKPQPQPVPLSLQDGAATSQRESEALLQRARREAERLSQDLQRLRSESDELGKRIAGDLEIARQEIERLSRRVKELERLVIQATPPRTSAQPPSWPSKSLFTFLGRPHLPSAQ